VLFHRYFQGHSAPQRLQYRGKHDLRGLDPPDFEPFLTELQVVLNEALSNQRLDVPGHVETLFPFHFDYIDSDVSNALAFRYEGYSFIGVTIPLIYQLWDVCVALSKSERVRHLLDLGDLDPDPLRVVLFRVAMFFVVLHEWTHHVHGHLASAGEPIFPYEVLDESQIGGLEDQVLEADADGYAVFYVLANLIGGLARSTAVELLGLSAELEVSQDGVLFSCFVVAVGAFLFVGAPVDVDSTKVYKLTHPPQALRFSSIMQWAMSWCTHNRPGLDEAWMGLHLFQPLMDAVAEATWDLNGGRHWRGQVQFLRSDEGVQYARDFRERVENYVRSLRSIGNPPTRRTS